MKTESNEKTLPEGILESDLKRPNYFNLKTGLTDRKRELADGRAYYESVDPLKKAERNLAEEDFEIWYTKGFGWVIPTLLISRASRYQRSMDRGATDRTYAVSIRTGQLVSCGRGPHVLRTETVYVTKPRLAALQKYLDIRKMGAEQANTYRDRLSSRRAQTSLRRRSFLW